MAVTSAKSPREIIYGADVGSGVNSKGTTPQTQTTYKPSAQVQQAQQQMQQVQAQKPQAYASKYGAQLDGILQQITNPKEFKYEFNGDEMFKYYADLYTQKGRQASMDAMGQAAALTGGYGNSYAQQVGNQAYDQYLLNLYDKGMELRDAAYQQYLNDRNDLYNQYGTLYQQDQSDYGRYRDTVDDWERDRGYYTDMYNNERNFDYGQFSDQRAFDENVRQFNESLNWDMMSTEQKYAAEYAMQLLSAGQMPSDELLAAAGLSAADAQAILAPMLAVGGGGPGGNPKGKPDTDPPPEEKDIKPKSLLALQHGAETELINKAEDSKKILTAKTPAGPINTSVKPAAIVDNTKKQTAQQILQNGFTENYKRYKTMKSGS